MCPLSHFLVEQCRVAEQDMDMVSLKMIFSKKVYSHNIVAKKAHILISEFSVRTLAVFFIKTQLQYPGQSSS